MNKDKIKYPVSTVAIQNKVTECFKSMSVDEKRILIMASPIARNIDAREQDSILISAKQFSEDCGIKINSGYKQLEAASRKLVDRSFSYTNEKEKRVYSNWVIDATYEDAGVSLRFTSIVLVMLKVLDQYNPYTRYKKDVVLKLKKDYSIDFYHLAKKNQSRGEFKLTIDEMFLEFGLPDSYRDLRNLKRRVLNNSLDEINEFTDIEISAVAFKKGRSVDGFSFKVKQKQEQKLIAQEKDTKTIDMFCNLSNAQINMYSSILSKVSSISDLAGAKDYQAFAIWLASILRDPKSVRKETAERIFKALRTETDFKD